MCVPRYEGWVCFAQYKGAHFILRLYLLLLIFLQPCFSQEMMVLLAVSYVLGEEMVTVLDPAPQAEKIFLVWNLNVWGLLPWVQFAAYPVNWLPGVGVGWLFSWSALEARRWLGKPLERLSGHAAGCCLLQSLRCPQLCIVGTQCIVLPDAWILLGWRKADGWQRSWRSWVPGVGWEG